VYAKYPTKLGTDYSDFFRKNAYFRALAGPWKSFKVLEYFFQIFKAWKVLENGPGP